MASNWKLISAISIGLLCTGHSQIPSQRAVTRLPARRQNHELSQRRKFLPRMRSAPYASACPAPWLHRGSAWAAARQYTVGRFHVDSSISIVRYLHRPMDSVPSSLRLFLSAVWRFFYGKALPLHQCRFKEEAACQRGPVSLANPIGP